VRLVEAEADAEKLVADFVPGAAAFDHDELLIESYIPGEEISAEAIVIDGKLLLLALTDKVNSGSPYFQECGHIVPSRHRHLQADVSAYLQATVTALGMVTAPLHAELKIVGDRLEIVELNVRFGGGNIVRLVSGAMKVRPFRLYLDALLGGRPDEDAYTPDVVWGVGFFTARVGETLSWPSYAFPRPECVTELDMRADRQPKLTDFGGVRIRYWRPGHALFSSPDYQAVRANIEFMAAQTPG
jgi:hypothetical protein